MIFSSNKNFIFDSPLFPNLSTPARYFLPMWHNNNMKKIYFTFPPNFLTEQWEVGVKYLFMKNCMWEKYAFKGAFL